MNFVETASTLVNASQPLVWVRTHEVTEARMELLQHMRGVKNGPRVYCWSLMSGMTGFDGSTLQVKASDGFGDIPLSGSANGLSLSIKLFLTQLNDENNNKYKHVLIVENFHQFLQDVKDFYMLVQSLQDFAVSPRSTPSSILLLSTFDHKIPVDLKSYCSIVDHDLPTEGELYSLAERVLSNVAGDIAKTVDRMTSAHITKLAHAGLGLSRLQYESELAFSLAKSADDVYRAKEETSEDAFTECVLQIVQDRKATLFNAEGLVHLHRSNDTVAEIGGMQGLKTLVKRRFDRQDERYRKDHFPKGLILLGPPGTAKSTFAKAIGNMLGILTATVDLGSVKEGIVGATEGRIRRLFQILKAMGRIIVFVDEIEKAFPTGDELDSGVSADMLSVLLTNLADPERQYYVVASANNCHKLPAPLLRSGRFDNIVMVDLPKPDQQKLIWEICKKRYGISESEPLPPHKDWSGAEINSCCEFADGLGYSLAEAAKMIVPTALLNPEAVEAVREYAHGRAIDAETGRIYCKPGGKMGGSENAPPAPERRKIVTPKNAQDN